MKAKKYPNLAMAMMSNNETYVDVAKVLKVCTSSACKKINGNVPTTVEEAKTLCKHYGKSFEELFG